MAHTDGSQGYVKPFRPNLQQTHALRKRPASKQEIGKNIFHISSTTSVQGIIKECIKLYLDGSTEIIIYSLGAAIEPGILVATQVQEAYSSVKVSANTYTTDVFDDWVPLTEDVNYEVQTRLNSALKIVLTFQK